MEKTIKIISGIIGLVVAVYLGITFFVPREEFVSAMDDMKVEQLESAKQQIMYMEKLNQKIDINQNEVSANFLKNKITELENKHCEEGDVENWTDLQDKKEYKEKLDQLDKLNKKYDLLIEKQIKSDSIGD